MTAWVGQDEERRRLTLEVLADVDAHHGIDHQAVQALTAAPLRLLDPPRIGERLDEFAAREVRRILVGHHEVRDEIDNTAICVLRLWCGREDR